MHMLKTDFLSRLLVVCLWSPPFPPDGRKNQFGLNSASRASHSPSHVSYFNFHTPEKSLPGQVIEIRVSEHLSPLGVILKILLRAFV